MKKSGGSSGGKKTGSKRSSATLSATRNLAVRVHTAHKRTPSSTRWLERQLNDPYVAEARKQGWRSRAAFKLLQMDEKFHLLKPHQRVVDLGAAPGGWTQVAVQRVKPEQGKGCVVGLDLLEMDAVPGAEVFVGDFTKDEDVERLRALLGGPANVVLSDMAANTTGHTQTDHLRITMLAELAAEFAYEVLAPGGVFVCKLFQGGAEKTLLDGLKKNFAVVKHAKPAASRSDSAEMYIVATGFRGTK
jgi:23S rRNA (uridine2552-2'-O)-methyltransferase